MGPIAELREVLQLDLVDRLRLADEDSLRGAVVGGGQHGEGQGEDDSDDGDGDHELDQREAAGESWWHFISCDAGRAPGVEAELESAVHSK